MAKKYNCFHIINSIIFILGMGILAYPVVADYMAQSTANSVISSYNTSMASNTSSLSFYAQQAYSYNDALAASENIVGGEKNSDGSIPDANILTYNEQLSISGDSKESFAWVQIPKLSEQLPVYHGTSDDTLQAGIGHLEGTSLPIGGNNSHSVLTAHSGMPGCRMFDDIGRLEEGDEILIHVLDKTLTYKVTYKETVLPEELESLHIQEGKDMVTLVTCTPYGINTHRLLVHAERDIVSGVNSALPGELGNNIINARTAPFLSVIFAISMFTIGFITVKKVKYGKIKQTRDMKNNAISGANAIKEASDITNELVSNTDDIRGMRHNEQGHAIRLENIRRNRKS